MSGNFFPRAVELVLEREGVFSSDAIGGDTKYGIAKRFHPDVDIANLTKDGAIAIYKLEYYDRAGCNGMPWPWALTVFDAAVNQGVVPAIEMAQKALSVKPDGHVGPVTLEAMSGAGWLARLADFLALRCVSYAHDAGAGQYEHGWFRRVFLMQQAGLMENISPAGVSS